MEKQEKRDYIAKRVALELKAGNVVNLGIGLPSLVANYIKPESKILFQAENGFVGMGENANQDNQDPDLINASGTFSSIIEGAAFFDSALSFAMIRGGHVDITVLGALQVDQYGNIASWIVPNKMIPGMGGAMDLIVGAKKVIVAMEHISNDQIKIVPECTLPLTAKEQVNLIITELAVFEIVNKTLVLKEIAPHSSLEEIKKYTQANFKLAS